MKNLILILFLGLMLSLTSNFRVQAQTETTVQTELEADQILTAPPVENVGFFKKLINSVQEDGIAILIGLIGGVFAKKGWIATFKKWLGYGITVTQSLSHLLASTSNGLAVVNTAIEDNGKLKQNSLKEIMAAKKEFTIDLNDALLTVKPKPAA